MTGHFPAVYPQAVLPFSCCNCIFLIHMAANRTPLRRPSNCNKWILIQLCQLCVSFLLVWYLGNGFEKALCQPSDSGSLEALVRSPPPVDWENILGRGNDTAESGVSAPRGAEADAGPTYPDNPREPFLEKFPIPSNVMEELDRELRRKTIRVKNLFAEEGLETPFTNPSSGEYFRQDCLDRWKYQYLIRAKLLVILTTHFGLSDEGGGDLYHNLDKILTHPTISLWKQDLPFLAEMYHRLFHDETGLRCTLNEIQKILSEKFDLGRR